MVAAILGISIMSSCVGDPEYQRNDSSPAELSGHSANNVENADLLTEARVMNPGVLSKPSTTADQSRVMVFHNEGKMENMKSFLCG